MGDSSVAPGQNRPDRMSAMKEVSSASEAELDRVADELNDRQRRPREDFGWQNQPKSSTNSWSRLVVRSPLDTAH
jgi:hypothetical protein